MDVVSVLVISGSMGAGKTTVMNEVTDLLAAQGIVHAAIDLDTLGIVHLPPGAPTDDLMYANLAAIWANYATAGVKRLVIARALETRAELDRLRAAVREAQVVVCRLRAPVARMEMRVREREAGIWQAKYVKRVAELDGLLDVAAVDDFSINNDERTVTEVARELLQQARWT